MAHIKSMDDLRDKAESDDSHDENDYYAGGKSGQIIRGPPVSLGLGVCSYFENYVPGQALQSSLCFQVTVKSTQARMRHA